MLRHAFAPEAETWFSAIVGGEDVTRKKPDPEAYLRVLAALQLEPTECVAIEDSTNGIDAARAAGLAVVATPSFYLAGDDLGGAALVVPDLSSGADVATLAALLNV